MESKRILLLFNNTNSKQNHDKQSSYQNAKEKSHQKEHPLKKDSSVGDIVC